MLGSILGLLLPIIPKLSRVHCGLLQVWTEWLLSIFSKKRTIDLFCWLHGQPHEECVLYSLDINHHSINKLGTAPSKCDARGGWKGMSSFPFLYQTVRLPVISTSNASFFANACSESSVGQSAGRIYCIINLIKKRKNGSNLAIVMINSDCQLGWYEKHLWH